MIIIWIEIEMAIESVRAKSAFSGQKQGGAEDGQLAGCNSVLTDNAPKSVVHESDKHLNDTATVC